MLEWRVFFSYVYFKTKLFKYINCYNTLKLKIWKNFFPWAQLSPIHISNIIYKITSVYIKIKSGTFLPSMIHFFTASHRGPDSKLK